MKYNAFASKCLPFACLCVAAISLVQPAAAQTILARQWTPERGYYLTRVKMNGAGSALIWMIRFLDGKGKVWGSISDRNHAEVERERTALAAMENRIRALIPDTTLLRATHFQHAMPVFCADMSAPMPAEYGEEISAEERDTRQEARALLEQARVLFVQAGDAFRREDVKRVLAHQKENAALAKNAEAIAGGWICACQLDELLADESAPHRKRILRQEDALLAALRQLGEQARQLAEKTPAKTLKTAVDPAHPTEAEKQAAQEADDQGLALYRSEKYAEAKEAFLRACRLNPTDPVPQTHLGLLLEKQESFVEAEAIYRELAKSVPDLPAPHYWLGKALYFQKKYDSANVALRKAIELAPKRWIYHYYLATSLREQGDAPAAATEQALADRLRKEQPTETP